MLALQPSLGTVTICCDTHGSFRLLGVPEKNEVDQWLSPVPVLIGPIFQLELADQAHRQHPSWA